MCNKDNSSYDYISWVKLNCTELSWINYNFTCKENLQYYRPTVTNTVFNTVLRENTVVLYSVEYSKILSSIIQLFGDAFTVWIGCLGN